MKTVAQTLLILTLLYGGVLLVGYFIQDALLYCPVKYTVEEAQKRAAEMNLAFWPEVSGYRGFVPVSSVPLEQSRGTAIVIHGSGATAFDSDGFGGWLQSLKFRPLLYEYPGRGARDGPLNENYIARDLREVIRKIDLAKQGPVYLIAHSLGCGVAASAVADGAIPVKGLVLVAPWDTLADVAQIHYPFAPTKLLVGNRYDSVANLSRFKGRIVIVRMGRDEAIPSSNQLRLYESLSCPKKEIFFPESDHDGSHTESDPSWWQIAMDFVAPRSSSSSAP